MSLAVRFSVRLYLFGVGYPPLPLRRSYFTWVLFCVLSGREVLLFSMGASIFTSTLSATLIAQSAAIPTDFGDVVPSLTMCLFMCRHLRDGVSSAGGLSIHLALENCFGLYATVVGIRRSGPAGFYESGVVVFVE